MFLFNAGEAVLDRLFVGRGLGLFAQVLNRADQKSTRAAGRIEDRFAEARIDLFDDKLGDGAGRVKLAGVARGLQILEEFFVDIAEHVAIVAGVEVDAVDFVDDLAHQRAVFHVVVGILKRHADQAADLVRAAGEGFELGQKRIVDEVEERLAGDPLFVLGPGGPAEMFGERRLVIVANEVHLLLAIVEDLEEKHPAELFQTLRVAVRAGVLAHDVLDRLDDVRDVGHRLGGFLIKCGFEFADRSEIILLGSEDSNDLDRRAKGAQRINLENFERFYTL